MKRRSRKSWTSSSFSGPPMFSIRMPVLGFLQHISLSFTFDLFSPHNRRLISIFPAFVEFLLRTPEAGPDVWDRWGDGIKRQQDRRLPDLLGRSWSLAWAELTRVLTAVTIKRCWEALTVSPVLLGFWSRTLGQSSGCGLSLHTHTHAAPDSWRRKKQTRLFRKDTRGLLWKMSWMHSLGFNSSSFRPLWCL